MLLYAKMVGKGWSFPYPTRTRGSGRRLSRKSRNTPGTHTSTYTAAVLTHTNTHTNTHTRTYAHIQTHIQTRIQTHVQTHIHAHMHTYKHMHAAIRKNGREGLVFPVPGRVGI